MLKEIREYIKSVIREREKGDLRHFHRTSMENFEVIVETERLLSRSKLKEIRPDVVIPGRSASDDVMMTRDVYDSDGKLIRPGFDSHEVV